MYGNDKWIAIHLAFMSAMHNIYNLAYKVLLEPNIFKKVEAMLKKIHAYLSHSQKKHLEFFKLVEVMEIVMHIGSLIDEHLMDG